MFLKLVLFNPCVHPNCMTVASGFNYFFKYFTFFSLTDLTIRETRQCVCMYSVSEVWSLNEQAVKGIFQKLLRINGLNISDVLCFIYLTFI
jgi:hypothetical protein